MMEPKDLADLLNSYQATVEAFDWLKDNNDLPQDFDSTEMAKICVAFTKSKIHLLEQLLRVPQL